MKINGFIIIIIRSMHQSGAQTVWSAASSWISSMEMLCHYSSVLTASDVWQGLPAGHLQLVWVVQTNARCVSPDGAILHTWPRNTRQLQCIFSDNGGWSVYFQTSLLVTWSGPVRPREKCELRKCEWVPVFCELKCEAARDWSDIFRQTRSLPGETTFAHSWNFLSGNNMASILTHTTCVSV